MTAVPAHQPDEPDVPHLAVAASIEDQGVAELGITAMLAVAHTALEAGAAVEPSHLRLGDIIETLEQLRGPNGIISAFQIIDRALEDAALAQLPRDPKRPEHAQKWTAIPGWRLERTGSGSWTINSRRALERLFEDMGDITPAEAADLVINHIGSIDRAWKVTELRESLGGPIPKPKLDANGQPEVYQRDTKTAKKGDPKMEYLDRLVEEEWGERSKGRDTLRIHRGDS